MWKKASIALVSLLLTACATSGPATDGCEWTRYILVGRQDVLTEDTARQILAHNETREQICR